MKEKLRFPEPHILITNDNGRVSVRSSFAIEMTLQILGVARDSVFGEAMRQRFEAELLAKSSGIVSVDGKPLVSAGAIKGNNGGLAVGGDAKQPSI